MPYRTGKQIRDRFLNVLDNNLNREKFTFEEDQKIIKLYKSYGKSWSRIAKSLKGRTGDMVKNRFYSSLQKIVEKRNLKKKLLEKKEEEKDKVEKVKKKWKKKKIIIIILKIIIINLMKNNCIFDNNKNDEVKYKKNNKMILE